MTAQYINDIDPLTTSEKVIRAFNWLVIFIAMGGVIIFGYWYLYPYKIADFEIPFKVQNPIVNRGERLRYEVKYCKYTDQVSELTKFFVDGVIFETPKTTGVATRGCGTVVSDVYVPRAIPPGNYTLKIVSRYRVNPVRVIDFINTTDPFVVK